jgi:hypothetical protein
MASEITSLQEALNRLMNTGKKDTYVTRIWSTCSRMLTMKGFKGKVQDKLTYIIDDSTSPLPSLSVLECVQKSSKRILKVTVSERKGVEANFGDLYAQFLIEGHTHTTHYVSMSREFPVDKDINTKVTDVSLRCKVPVSETKIIVLVALDFKEKKSEGENASLTSVVSDSEVTRRPTKEILKTLLERLLVDEIDCVVVLANSDETIAQPSLFEEVIQNVKEVCIKTSTISTGVCNVYPLNHLKHKYILWARKIY